VTLTWRNDAVHDEPGVRRTSSATTKAYEHLESVDAACLHREDRSALSSKEEPISEPPLESSALLDWPEVRERCDWTGLLVGNGASVAFWNDFRYDSIFERAQAPSLDHRLNDDDRSIFDAFNTTNFEQVLAALKTSRTVLGVLGRDADFIRERYESIQSALFDAVHSVHVSWGTSLTFERKLRLIRDEIVTYRWIYSLNYDLILYWAVMSRHGGRGVIDFFWNDDLSFDPGHVEPFEWAEDWSRIVWLHGRIHLRRHLDGTTFKTRASPETARNLLDKFKTSYTSNKTPLLVSEGTAEDKYRAITRSSYLEFGLRSLATHEGGLVIFGSSLRAEDQHLVRAVDEQPVTNLAFSMRPEGKSSTVRQRKAELRAKFPSSNLYFFDSTTHPLGAAEVRVRRNLFGRIV